MTRNPSSEDGCLKRTWKPWLEQGDLRREKLQGRVVVVGENIEIPQIDGRGAVGLHLNGDGEGGWSELELEILTGEHSRDSMKNLLEGGGGQDWRTRGVRRNRV